MVSQKATINNLTGLYVGPAELLCKTAGRFQSRITVRHKNTSANAKSVLSILGATIKRGDEVEVVCEGEDEKEALETMIGLINDGIGE